MKSEVEETPTSALLKGCSPSAQQTAAGSFQCIYFEMLQVCAV